jgi:hypothetical protein
MAESVVHVKDTDAGHVLIDFLYNVIGEYLDPDEEYQFEIIIRKI